MTVSGDTLVKNEKGGGVSVSVSEKNKEQLIEDAVNVLIQRRVGDRDEYVEFATRYDDYCRSCHSNDLSALAKDKAGHTADDYGATEHKMNEECRKQMNVAANNKTLCFTATYSKTDAVDTQQTLQRLDTRQVMTDDRMITADRFRCKVSENNNWSPQQPEDLYNVLIKYQQHPTERPGKCTKFEYEF